MAHGLVIVIGEDWEAQLQAHCIHREDGTEGGGHFDWCEIGGRFGKPLMLRHPQPRRGLFRLLGAKTRTNQARRLEVNLQTLRDHFPFKIVFDGNWHEPQTFDEAKQLLDKSPDDPVLTAIDYHL
jgi:hypothetical protein